MYTFNNCGFVSIKQKGFSKLLYFLARKPAAT